MLFFGGWSFFAGLSFFDGATVLPVLVVRLGGADWVVGLCRFLQAIGVGVPVLIAAHRIHGRSLHRRFMMKATVAGLAGITIIALGIGFWALTRPLIALVATLAGYAVFWFTDGFAAVSWFDIVSKTVPSGLRGRFFGLLQSGGGIVAMAAGAAVLFVLSSHGPLYPNSFVLLAALWALCTAGTLISYFALREPIAALPQDMRTPPFVQYVRAAPAMLSSHPRLARLIATRILLDAATLAVPFYVLYARSALGVPLTAVGVYIAVQSGGRIALGPLWGLLGERYGPANTLSVVAAAVVAIPAVVLLSTAHHWLLPLAFLLLGGAGDGVWMVGSTVMMESVAAHEVPTGLAVSSMCQTPGALFALLGGALAQTVGYKALFAVAIALGLVALLMALQLRKLPALAQPT